MSGVAATGRGVFTATCDAPSIRRGATRPTAFGNRVRLGQRLDAERAMTQGCLPNGATSKFVPLERADAAVEAGRHRRRGHPLVEHGTDPVSKRTCWQLTVPSPTNASSDAHKTTFPHLALKHKITTQASEIRSNFLRTPAAPQLLPREVQVTVPKPHRMCNENF